MKRLRLNHTTTSLILSHFVRFAKMNEDSQQTRYAIRSFCYVKPNIKAKLCMTYIIIQSVDIIQISLLA